MKANLNHIQVVHTINDKFNLTSYQSGKFTHFKKDDIEIGYIERIPATKKYFNTILVNFFCFEDQKLNDDVIKTVESLYKKQKEAISNIKPIESINYCIELRGTTINKSIII